MVSPSVSPSLTRPPSPTESPNNLTPITTGTAASNSSSAAWTPDQETRLLYCQDQLKQAQKKWSDRQELWIREVEDLLEQKRLHLKAQKGQQQQQKESTTRRIWKTKSWKRRPSGGGLVGAANNQDEDGAKLKQSEEGQDEDGGDDDEEEADLDEDAAVLGRGPVRSESFPLASPHSLTLSHSTSHSLSHSNSLSYSPSSSTPPVTPLSSPSSNNNNNNPPRNPFKKIIRRMSSATKGKNAQRRQSRGDEIDGTG